MKNGATTLWENWDGWTPERGFRDPSANSFNHYGFGSVGEWMYATIGGIAFDRDAPGGKHFLIRPRPGADLSHARMKLDSAHGPITSDWRLAEGTFHLSLTIPANTTATVSLPSGGPVTEGGRKIDAVAGVRPVSASERQTVVEVESGAYELAMPMRAGLAGR